MMQESEPIEPRVTFVFWLSQGLAERLSDHTKGHREKAIKHVKNNIQVIVENNRVCPARKDVTTGGFKQNFWDPLGRA